MSPTSYQTAPPRVADPDDITRQLGPNRARTPPPCVQFRRMKATSDISTLFATDGETYVPSEASRGPWDPNAMHGGPVAALMAREMERVGFQEGIAPARMTIELLRPALLVPLRIQTRLIRPGKRVNLVEVTVLEAEEHTEIARATALGIRSVDLALPDQAKIKADPPPRPTEGAPPERPPGTRDDLPAFYPTAVEMSVVKGAPWKPGPASAWIKLKMPVVDDEVVTPLMRVAAAADFGNGISSVLPMEKYVFINPDLTVYLHRMPVGEWICLEATTYAGSSGIGLAESLLHDTEGPIGRSLQGLFIDQR